MQRTSMNIRRVCIEHPVNIQRLHNGNPMNIQRVCNEHPVNIQRLHKKQFKEKSHFFDVEAAQLGPVLVMFFGPTALQFNPFPVYPLHAPRAGPQKSSQICVLLPQVASLDDLSHVTNIILMTYSCMRHYVGDILTYPT